MEAPPQDPPAHVHRLPRVVRVAVAGLVLAVFLLLVALGLMAVFVYQQQLYIEGRGEYRDREAARIETETSERLRRAMCDLLDTFPEDAPALERAREKYQCGPGIPLDLLPPEEQARIQSSRPVPPPPPPALREGASPNRQAPGSEPIPPRPEPAPAAPTTSPAPEPPPVDPGAVTTRVCQALDICID